MKLDRDRIRGIVEAIGERLEGDWLLVGGGLVALWCDENRTTEDCDIVGIAGHPDPRFGLLELAEQLGLPVETLNSAADFFVRRVPDWKAQVELLHEGSLGRVFRPNATLFLLLKLGRLSDQDLADCLGILAHVEAGPLPLDRKRVLTALHHLAPTTDAALAERRRRLADAVNRA